ncbi:phosphoethanolamine transferase [Desulforhabdus amnigena]|nr:sulfatase-like hydrolase/transferase [Desulforhabdus amnigena]NLJ29609.1 lipid A phosphoethanolamine transferase [Deltaproteobacteria bacterium]
MFFFRSSYKCNWLAHFTFLIMISILYNWIYNYNFISLWGNDNILFISRNAIITYIITYAFYQTIAINRLLFSITTPIIFLLSSLSSYFINHYKMTNLSAQSIAFAAESNLEEASAFIGQDLITRVLTGLVISIVIICVYNRSRLQCKTWTKLKLILMSAIVSVSLALYYEFPSPLPLPFGIFEATLTYAKEQQRFKEMSQAKTDISNAGDLAQEGNEDITVILIIGESARSDHFHINGYPRGTSPNIEKLGVLSFKDVTSCGVSTRESVPCMMTRATPDDLDPSIGEKSFISVFKRLGFYTAWISNQRVMGDNDTPITSIAREAEYVYFGNKGSEFIYTKLLDEDLLETLDTCLNQPVPRKMIVLHTVGSHWFYENHYTDAFRLYTPVCTQKEPGNCTHEELINSYDNTILYTDHFIKDVIDRVSSTNSIVFYLSDHGESLGEEGRFGHGQAGGFLEQKKIPFLVWPSNRYMIENAEKLESLKAHLNSPLTHDNLFHSILDCAGIHSSIIDPGLSICR